ncbi:mevalonate kinase family protein [Hugenholtzia roseola]|uniref:mevalonate kinase family protein n=1 Tax=Hugenholtzia roseola TaxID=1002 RepID=UPI00047CE911|nr:mevalonate kinase [Hugenholtzia roseola]
MKNPYFNSKILLFGEYSIIKDSMGLALPYDLFQGRLIFKNVTQVSSKILQSNQELRTFVQYLEQLTKQDDFPVQFDFTSLHFDLEQGLFFESTIPQGFGVGSSGALTAALYYGYARNKIKINGHIPTQNEILELKRIFAKMESHFHGSSSGFDPLICYLNRPLLIKNKSEIEATSLPDFKGDRGAIFILNTGRARRTEPLVSLFLEKCKSDNFEVDKLIEYNNTCIKSLLTAQLDTLFDTLKELSYFQYKNLQPMIPTLYRKMWKQGLQTNDYNLKLCGAGGGGFILGFTQNLEKTKTLLAEQQIRIVCEL